MVNSAAYWPLGMPPPHPAEYVDHLPVSLDMKIRVFGDKRKLTKAYVHPDK